MTRRSAAFVAIGLACVCGRGAEASLTFIPGGPPLNPGANLVTNGSFEVGAPALGVQVPWASPSTPGYAVPSGWLSSGVDGSTYATWGSNGVVGQGIRGSAPFPDGISGMYFGNLFTDVSVAPTFQPSGRVTFPSAPVFTPSFGAPCELTQTINTHLSPAASYRLSFWVSGEDAAVPGNAWTPGIMGLRLTNVVPGNPLEYLSIPAASGGPNSRVYQYAFVPINPSLPVTVTFINWGHVTSIGGVGSGFTSELVLDDVIVNAVPAPGAAVVLAVGALGMTGRRRRR